MKSITKLKDEARRHEQKEEWEKAIRAYLQVLDAGDDDGEIELPLFNRVGDLYVRLGRSRDAVQYYEQAADRYAEAGLYNNAIALCNKALRYASGNLELLRKLGQFSAQQGFTTDAHRYFLEYAERQIEAGEIGAALSALTSFADTSDDPEVRELLGRKLHAHGRRSDAVHELRRAWDMRRQAGELDAAQGLRAEILAIDPGAFPDVEAASEAPTGAAGRAEPAPTAELSEPELAGPPEPAVPPSFTEPAAAAAPEPVDVEAPYRIDLPGLDAGVPEGTPQDAAPDRLEGLESGMFDGFADVGEAAPIAGLETDETFAAPADLPPLEVDGLEATGFGDDDLPPEPLPAETEKLGPWGEDWGDDDVAFDLPTLESEPGDAVRPPSFDLPLLEEEEEEELEPAGSLHPDSAYEPLPTLDDELPLPVEEEAAGPLPGLEPEPMPEPDADAFPEPASDFGALPGLEPEYDAAEPESGPLADFEAEPLPAIEDDLSDLQPLADFEAEPLPEIGDEPAGLPPLFDFEPLPDLESAETTAVPLPDLQPGTLPEPPAPRAQEPGPFADTPEPFAFVEEPDSLVEEPDSLADEPDSLVEEPEPFVEEPEPFTDAPAPLAHEPGAVEAELDPWSEAPFPAAEARDLQAEPERGPERGPEPEAPYPPPADFVDLAALIAGDDETSADTRFVVEEALPTGDEDQDFAELLSQFKRKVSAHVSAEDAAAHYDLGLAFKEMGLVDEAIGEFQIALRAGDMRLKVYEELGQCFLDKGQYAIAEKVLRRAAESKYEDELELLGVYYHLARAYEALDRPAEARDAYERVLGMDINFRDVAARIARL